MVLERIRQTNMAVVGHGASACVWVVDTRREAEAEDGDYWL